MIKRLESWHFVQALALRQSDSLRRRANAQNVSCQISLRWLIHIINSVDKTKLSCITPHWCSTTTSLETFIHLYKTVWSEKSSYTCKQHWWRVPEMFGWFNSIWALYHISLHNQGSKLAENKQGLKLTTKVTLLYNRSWQISMQGLINCCQCC